MKKLVAIVGLIMGMTHLAQAATEVTNISQQVSATATTTTGGRLVGYLTGWKTPPAAADLASAGYTHILVAFGVFSTIKPGEIVSAFDAVSATYIQSLKSSGIKVLLSLGGASSSIENTTTNFHEVLSQVSETQSFVDAFVSSMEDMMTQYGFDGFDFDIEQGLGVSGTFTNPTGDVGALVSIIKQMHSNHPDALLTLAPQMANISVTQGFDNTWGNYASLIMQTAPDLTWVGIQLYNSGCCYGLNGVCYAVDANDPDTYVAMAADLLENWPSTDSSGRATGYQPYISYLTPSQVILGFPAPNSSGVSDGDPAVVIATVKAAVQCLRSATAGSSSCSQYIPPKAYPDIGGVFNWEVSFDQANNYNFAKSLHDCVILGNCE